jgi:hypothetical protein
MEEKLFEMAGNPPYATDHSRSQGDQELQAIQNSQFGTLRGNGRSPDPKPRATKNGASRYPKILNFSKEIIEMFATNKSFR